MRRKHSIIDKLPAEIKETVDEMVRANFTYRDIVDYIKSTGNDISLASVGRYAANLNETVRSIRMAQENFRAIMEETERHPNLDATDGILCILSNQLLEAVNSLPEEQLQSADLNSLIKNFCHFTINLISINNSIHMSMIISDQIHITWFNCMNQMQIKMTINFTKNDVFLFENCVFFNWYTNNWLS